MKTDYGQPPPTITPTTVSHAIGSLPQPINQTSNTLAFTGMDIIGFVVAGIILIALGVLIVKLVRT